MGDGYGGGGYGGDYSQPPPATSYPSYGGQGSGGYQGGASAQSGSASGGGSWGQGRSQGGSYGGGQGGGYQSGGGGSYGSNGGGGGGYSSGGGYGGGGGGSGGYGGSGGGYGGGRDRSSGGGRDDRRDSYGMENYTNAEMSDMHFVYGRSNGNGRQARRLYAEFHPERRVPHHTIFARLHQRLRENGTFKKQTADCGRPREVRTVQLEEAVLELIAESPETSTRKIANILNVSNFSVFKILKEQQLYPFHIQRVQALLPRDFFPRLVFCHWILHQIVQIPNFLNGVLFTDEANFGRQCIQNFHNNHLWAEENPHGIFEAHFQHQFSVNVWLGVLHDHLIGPYFLPQRLTGDSYLNFLQEELRVLLEEIPLQMRQHFWFMHDGAPAHFSINVRNHLDRVYPNRWIGRGGTEHWPARSPDLNPLDFCIWGFLKSLVYSTPVENVEHLRNRIIAGCETIRNTPGIFARVRQSMRRRVESCITSEGGHFEHLL